MPEREHRAPDVWLYHNTFARGAGVFSLPSPRLMPEGVPGFRLLNNVLAPLRRSIGGGATTLGNASGVGLFAYNWAGATLPEIEIAWLGEGNILAPGEHPWAVNGEPRFTLPVGHAARQAGIDLSRPFRIGADLFDPLPGMTPGYFPGERPDMGAVQHPLSPGPEPES